MTGTEKKSDYEDFAAWLTRVPGRDLVAAAERLIAQRVAAHTALERLTKLALLLESPQQAVRFAWIIAEQRSKAVQKLGELGKAAFYDTDGLQMASGSIASAYHARLLQNSGAAHVIDLTAGIGADAIAFGWAGMRVTACEIDPIRAIFLKANVASAGLAGQVEIICGDGLGQPITSNDIVFCDPPRRTDGAVWGNQTFADAVVDHIAGSSARGALIKLAPATEPSIGVRYGGGSLSYVSVGGECREALLALGALRRSGAAVSAILLPEGHRIDAGVGSSISVVDDPGGAGFLYEPDPAVIRSGAASALAAENGWRIIEPQIAYYFGDKPIETPFASCYRILMAMPLHKKNVQSWLSDHNAGRLVIKKRGVAFEPDEVRSWFRLTGDKEVTLCLCPQQRKVWILALDGPLKKQDFLQDSMKESG
jgi:hypothetical protein